jgi:hypothetical protein
LNQSVGFDAGKKIKGRKRFMTVDTLGLVLRVLVTFILPSTFQLFFQVMAGQLVVMLSSLSNAQDVEGTYLQVLSEQEENENELEDKLLTKYDFSRNDRRC